MRTCNLHLWTNLAKTSRKRYFRQKTIIAYKKTELEEHRGSFRTKVPRHVFQNKDFFRRKICKKNHHLSPCYMETSLSSFPSHINSISPHLDEKHKKELKTSAKIQISSAIFLVALCWILKKDMPACHKYLQFDLHTSTLHILDPKNSMNNGTKPLQCRIEQPIHRRPCILFHAGSTAERYPNHV